MKQLLTAFFLCFCLALSLVSCQGKREQGRTGLPEEEPSPEETGIAPPKEEGFSMKGVWLSQFDLAEVYVTDGRQRIEADYTSRMEEILQWVKEMGFDTVVMQVHPYGDSFYPSAFFPDSRFITGAYGRKADYDAFAVAVALCQKLSLRLHAWINPLRLMKESEIVLLDGDHPLRRCYEEKTGEVTVWEGRCYLDPASPRAREWVALAARELCENYAIEGVHIDDYFYPTQDEDFDRQSYRDYQNGGGTLSLAEFRRENVSQMVSELYQTVKKADSGKLFGISPAGNVEHDYHTLYADVFRWCGEEGFADYICPQLYFGFEHEKCPFEQSVRRWYGLCQGGETELVIGLTLTKASLAEDPYAGRGRYEWSERDDIVKRSAQFVQGEGYCAGICVFSLSYLKDPMDAVAPSQAKREGENLLSVLPSLVF